MKPLDFDQTPIRLGPLLDLALVMDGCFEEGALGDQGVLLATAALNRIFPGHLHTIEKCLRDGEDCAPNGCGECPDEALASAADEALTAYLATRDRPPLADLSSIAVRHRIWSLASIGPGRRTAGLVKHVRKELVEIERNPDDAGEWVDVMLLGLDGYLRAGGQADQLADRISAKQALIRARSYTSTPEDQPCEHDRSDELPDVLAEVAEERRAQVAHGFTPEHDDAHGTGELACAAAHYAIAASMADKLGAAAWPSAGGPIAKMPRAWPWERAWWKPGCARRMLIKAIALLVADVERRDRASARAKLQATA